MRKRILLTCEKEPYERLQKNIQEAGLPQYWLSREIEKVIIGLDEIVLQILEYQKKGQKLTEQQFLETIMRTSEQVQKMKIKKIEFEDPEE